MHFFAITVLGIGFIFLCSTLGAALVYCFKKEFSKALNAAFLGLASGVMLAASVWSLLIPALEKSQNEWGRYAFILYFFHFFHRELLGGICRIRWLF